MRLQEYSHVKVLLFTVILTLLNAGATTELLDIGETLASISRAAKIVVGSTDGAENTSHCMRDINLLWESVAVGEQWALQMLDASSILQPGILKGNVHDLGMYDECEEVGVQYNPSNITGQHCMISFLVPPEFFSDPSAMLLMQRLSPLGQSAENAVSLSSSVCLPSSCNKEDVLRIAGRIVDQTPELSRSGIRVTKAICSRSNENNFTLLETLTICFFAVLVTFLIFCTICDYPTRTGNHDSSQAVKILAKFSLQRSALDLFNTKTTPGRMPAIHGLRVLSICWVVFVHRCFITAISPVANLADFLSWQSRWYSLFVFMISFIVDIFFVISGFLTTHQLLKSIGSARNKFNFTEICLRRYIKLTPCIVVLILFTAFCLRHIGSGPVWEHLIGIMVDSCRENWWTNIVYLQNVINPQNMCLPHTWYLAADMQLFWISRVILAASYYWSKHTRRILSLSLFVSMIVPPVLFAINGHTSAFFKVTNNTSVFEYRENFVNVYMSTVHRSSAYLVGVVLGYVIATTKLCLSKLQVGTLWILACAIMSLCAIATRHLYSDSYVYDVVFESAYAALARPAWAIAVAWMIYACTQGYGGPITETLSWPGFLPLSRLSYSVYLVHLVIQVSTAAVTRNSVVFLKFQIFHLFWGDLAISIGMAFLLSIFIEAPVMVLEKSFKGFHWSWDTSGQKFFRIIGNTYARWKSVKLEMLTYYSVPQLLSCSLFLILNTSMIVQLARSAAETGLWITHSSRFRCYVTKPVIALHRFLVTIAQWREMEKRGWQVWLLILNNEFQYSPDAFADKELLSIRRRAMSSHETRRLVLVIDIQKERDERHHLNYSEEIPAFCTKTVPKAYRYDLSTSKMNDHAGVMVSAGLTTTAPIFWESVTEFSRESGHFNSRSRMFLINCGGSTVLLFALLQSLVSASYLNDAENTKTVIQQVFNDLRSPLKEEILSAVRASDSTCEEELAAWNQAIQAGQLWALRMIDAASKIQSGILNGNIRDLGMYGECIGTNGEYNNVSIQGKHCMFSVGLASNESSDATNDTSTISAITTSSICVPSSCDEASVVEFINSVLNTTPIISNLGLAANRATCRPLEYGDFTVAEILTITFFSAIGAFIVACTICDFVRRSRPADSSTLMNTLAKFSMYTNALSILNRKVTPQTLPALHGIRVLSTCWVVFGHRYVTSLLRPMVNLLDITEWLDSWTSLYILLGPFAVDTFFVVSGFLMTYLHFKAIKAGKKVNLPMMYLHRYLRLTPSFAVIMLFSAVLLHRVANGPIWSTMDFIVQPCRDNWWVSLLYVHNFVHKEEMCLPHTWYLAVDMQLFWITPLILYPLQRWPKIGFCILGSFLLASVVTPAVVLGVNGYSNALVSFELGLASLDAFYKFYIPTYNRACAYFVGMILGYFTINQRRQFTQVSATVAWIITAGLLAFCTGATYHSYNSNYAYNLTVEILYAALLRPCWSIAIAWIIYACIHGHGGPITRFLSLPFFLPLSRLTYCIYLVHFVVQLAKNSASQLPTLFSNFVLFNGFLSDLLLSIPLAFIFSLFIESPVIVLEKILTNRDRKPEPLGKSNHDNEKDFGIRNLGMDKC
ncbi:uncharacterized protein LOC124412735 [Diprion similis]|uniref:uncharacterized protein LOC124412735 n=1 Tax=Diprion similis TaxID=362088 RepID=UPI001EF7ADE1|nr:uncharacterized protein LOC124412735 [Diprion similis]